MEEQRGEPHRRLYLVAVSHLDTQWRWTLRDTIARHLPKTLRENAHRFERFPNYVLSFDGAFRYRLIREYLPEQWPQLVEWVRDRRWHVAGAFLDAADTNLPSPESLIRQALYGRRWFREHLAVDPQDVFLPDCFGFGFALPSLMRHCGLTGFSSQKLSKGRAADQIPFSVGRWEGVDGSSVIAALEPGGYGEPLEGDLSLEREARVQIDALGARSSGVYVAQRYFGVGDTGGAPDEASLGWVERSIAGGGPVRVLPGGSDQIFAALSAQEIERLPAHRGELLLNLHASGCYTSQAAMKRWNRRNQALAMAAEGASCLADWLGAIPYPSGELREAWERFLVHQFHDDLPGTSIPDAYRFSWNDEILSLNVFARILEAAVASLGTALDTEVAGVPVVVFNPLARPRTDEMVEAEILLPPAAGVASSSLDVVAPDGSLSPAQVLWRGGPGATGRARVLFPASLGGVGCAVHEISPRSRVQPSPVPSRTGTARAELLPAPQGGAVLETSSLRVVLDAEGRIAQVEERSPAGSTGQVRSWLDRPVELESLKDTSRRFPAWEIRREDLAAPARECAGGPAEFRIVESGPWRSAIEVTRRVGRSRVVEIVRLAAGVDRVEVECEIDWRSRGRLLKLAVAAARPRDGDSDLVATYDLGLGSIERGVNSASLWEVPAQRFAVLSDRATGDGLGVFCDSRHGWDRPAPEVLRLTLLHTPRVGRRFRHQGRQDLGVHRVRWALAACSLAATGDPHRPHPADIAECLENGRLYALAVPATPGPLGREVSLLTIRSIRPGDPNIRLAPVSAPVSLWACKQAEDVPGGPGREVLIRVAETRGRPADVDLAFGPGYLAATEVDGVEDPVAAPDGVAAVEKSRAATKELALSLKAFGLRGVRVRLAPPSLAVAQKPPRSRVLALAGALPVATRNSDRSAADFDGRGRTYPAELLPERLVRDGVPFDLRDPRALPALGQVLALPADWMSLHLLVAAAVPGDENERKARPRDLRGVETQFVLGGRSAAVWVPAWSGFVGAWDGPLERTPVAWVGTHRHLRSGDDPYRFCYLWRVIFDLRPAVRELRLPDDPRIRLFAATLTDRPVVSRRLTSVLYD